MENLFSSIWHFLIEAAPYLMLGLFFAGLIHELVPMKWIEKKLGKGNRFSFITAAFVGIPLPLCSCSVIPTSVALRKKGASKAATSSFLIATPESGIDSISMTYALMDMPMTLIRPIAAFTSALMAGIAVTVFGKEDDQGLEEQKEASSCCHKKGHNHGHSHSHEASSNEGPLSTLWNSIRYGYGRLLEDISFWLTLGILLGGLIGGLVPPDYFTQVNPALQKLVIILVGLPLYICASASTPIALSLMMKGLSPGAALIFLLVGPATNFSNILVLQKALGKKVVILNLICIVIVAVSFGFLVDFLYAHYGWSLEFVNKARHDHGEHGSPLSLGLTVAFVLLLLRALYAEKVRPMLSK